ncbi:MAG: bifunctional GTP diphosphokinase/guanosine-3',5'-bis pyrophosphate 3'-pyrophosphohydrolase [Gammaproteobacteria bacterium]|nr:bifunctional GTP diphosphokinase/guanosine-3',5'-bis pyrophosphate 3'-pyrophosphohydrolase [Gammaproteobacteria bacterium]
MRLFKKLRRKLDYLDDEQIEQIHQAYLVALDGHRSQKRSTGEPYITHPVAVACLLADMKLDYQSIMAALLHDVIEDTKVSKEDLEQQFGKIVADLVDGVSKLTQIEFASKVEAQAENFRKMVMAMSDDLRVILVKLADRLHNMRTLGSLPNRKRRRIAQETLEIYAPIAKRLGMRNVSVELEEIGFMTSYPMRYRILKEAVRKARGNRKRVLHLIERTIKDGLTSQNLPSCVVISREKHLYSIYRKMRSKDVPFNEIMDVYAFRIIVDTADTCYRVLGVVHNLFKPVPERFKDYIAISKANGYQSLHTTLFGPYGLPIEVQIRTSEMHEMANSGIAAHWIYKSDEEDVSQSQIRAQQWVKSLLELQQSSGNSLEFIENVKVDLFPDEVYIFTPRGEIMELPAGATAIDFAYAVHTDVGNGCVAVKIDRQLAPLSTVLRSGQTVEVITSSRGVPDPAWLDFVVTSKARSGIRHFLKNQQRGQAVSLGQQMLDKFLASQSMALKKTPKAVMDFVIEESGLKSIEELFADIGLGNRAAALTAQRIVDVYRKEQHLDQKETKQVEQTPLVIKGTEGMVLKFAKCCCPIPGDPIVGILNAGKGVTVHAERCEQILKLRRNPDQTVSLRWSSEIKESFLVSIRLEVINQRGALAVMSLAISDAEANIEDISVEEREGSHYFVTFKLFVKDRPHLAKVMRNLRQIPAVEKIIRS